ncbi:DMT family transporter [Halioxenophilus aromaticivorans]|uniref:EamA domain-containing protein n=1 Tax=Halioxenophilus aromaticivorans TaxID=1306992 RepID=A0AAV3U4H7_9ALTE
MEVIYALLSSIMFAATFLLVKIGRESASHLSVLWITLTINVVVLGLSTLFIDIPKSLTLVDLKFFIVSGIFAPLLGRLFQFVGMSRLGANTTTALTLTHPLVTVLIGLVFLGESGSVVQMLGAFLIITGSLLIAIFSGSNGNLRISSGYQIYLIYPLLASLTYGISIALRKVGIDQLNSPVLASAVTVSASWIILSLYILVARCKISCSSREFTYFVYAGILSSIGPIFLYLSLAVGNLLLIAPLAATTPLFVLVGTWLYSKNNEKFGYQIIVGTVGIFIGVTLLTLFKN